MKKSKVHDRIAESLPINSVVALAKVDDPLEPGAYIHVLRSIRTDPFARMVSHCQIDNVQFAAGRLYQLYRERSEIGGGHAIDMTETPVDGGRHKEPDVTALSHALAQLRRAADALQPYEASIVYDVLTRNMSISQIAVTRSISARRQVDALMDTFREALDVLAVVYGLSTEQLGETNGNG